jgi:hypothetical protein
VPKRREQRRVTLAAAILSAALLDAGPSGAGVVADGLARMLEGVPAERLATGLLYDRALPLSRIDLFDGRAGAPSATPAEWRQMLHEISRASIAPPSWPGVGAIVAKGRALEREGIVAIALLNFRYERIRRDALATGALVARDGRLVAGVGDAFETRRVFAAATLRERTFRGERVVFRIDREAYLTNDGAAPLAVEVDFDDGRGPVPVEFGRAVEVRYAAPGPKTLAVRVAFSDGAVRFAGAAFEVASLVTPPPDDTLHVTASIPYLGQTAGGDAYVYLAPGHAAPTVPVVVIEGFDLDNSMNWDELYALLNREQLLETLRSHGFDAVVLNFADATDYVQRNAFVIVELLEQVRATIPEGIDIALVGASMGGLAARYALAYMESQALPHEVRTFISFDSPQSGANIPLGIQYWLAFFADDSPDAAALLAALDSPASRQMLVYHHTEPPGATGESDALRAGLIADLAAVGGYPDAPRNVAVANGSGAQAGQGFSPGDQIVRWEYESFLVDITGNVWAVPDASSHTVFHGIVDFILLPADQRVVSVSGTRPFDNAPGGSRASMAQMDAVPAPYGDIVALHGSHAFIPTVSALDLATADLFYDVANDPDILASTPFDAVYFPAANQEHVLITPENAAWVIAEIENGVTGVATPPVGASGAAALAAWPNPFREEARIRFALPRAGAARLSVHDASGRRVGVLLDGRLEAGEHAATWDGTDASGRRAGPGVYFLTLSAPDFATARKIVLR